MRELISTSKKQTNKQKKAGGGGLGGGRGNLWSNILPKSSQAKKNPLPPENLGSLCSESPELSKIPPFTLGVGQKIDLHAAFSARASARVVSAVPADSTSFPRNLLQQ